VAKINVNRRYTEAYRKRRERESRKAFQEGREFDLRRARGHGPTPTHKQPPTATPGRESTESLLRRVQKFNPDFDNDFYDRMVDDHGARAVRSRLQRLIKADERWRKNVWYSDEGPEGGDDGDWSRELGDAPEQDHPWWFYHGR